MTKHLIEAYPEIAKDWDYAKNQELNPLEVFAHSKESVWWTCEKAHKYQVSVYSRVRSKGCKFCLRHEYSSKSNTTKLNNSQSLAKHSPELITEWNYSKNLQVNPETVSFGSNKKVWWKCSKGHEWEVSPKVRTRGSNCPECGRVEQGKKTRARSLVKAGRSLAEAHPMLVSEWDYDNNLLSPQELPPRSNYRASWICKFGHRWEATVDNRAGNKSNCPECNPQSSRLEIYLLCEIRSIFPKSQWRSLHEGVECDIYIPEKKLGIEVDGQYWHAKKLHKDTEKTKFFIDKGIHIARVRDNTLPDIEGQVIKFSRNEPLQDITNKLLSVLAQSVNEFYAYPGTQQRESEFTEMVARLPAPPDGETLKDTHPEITKEWCYEKNGVLTPELFSKGSNQKFWWKCKYGHYWQSAINNRVSRNSGCPDCYLTTLSERSRKSRLKKTKSLIQANPSYLIMYDLKKNELPPSEIAVKSNIDIWWRCQFGHSFRKKPIYMADNHDCPICNTLPIMFPEIAAEWNFEKNQRLDPSKLHAGSGVKVWWKCKKDHEWEATISMRTNAGTGCPHCYNENRSNLYRKLSSKRSGSLLDFNPEYLSEWDFEKNKEFTPDAVTAKSRMKVWWKCKNGHSYIQAIASKYRGSGCPKCMKAIWAENIRLIRLKKSGSLQDYCLEITSHWHSDKNGDLTPQLVSSGSSKIAWWKCVKGHEWALSISTLTEKRRSFICPVCKNLKSN